MAEEKEIIRQNLNNITAEEKERRIGALKASRGFVLKSFLPVAENCHFERYNFICGREKLSIVYDTKAQIFTLTALSGVLERVAKVMAAKPPVSQKSAKVQKSGAPQKSVSKKNTHKAQQELSSYCGERFKKSAVERSLKKLLPDAYDLLSEQSKTDIGIGMIDLGNPQVKLSDYSVLLVPPYRGLERFIYDLQQAHGISLKMIGQAYEKDDDGKHVLKSCYRKKAGIVYSEVMSALYGEYFEKRNFYAHSDNSELGSSRVIGDKENAKVIFGKLCEIMNYNSKKLKETNFKEKYYG